MYYLDLEKAATLILASNYAQLVTCGIAAKSSPAAQKSIFPTKTFSYSIHYWEQSKYYNIVIK